jgi:c(7)-type cytochrome triheme protein
VSAGGFENRAHAKFCPSVFAILLAVVFLAGCPSKQTSEPGSKASTPQPSEPAPQAAADVSKTPPDTILIQSPYGNVTFTHAKHYERVNGDCSVCHPKVFPQSLAPLNYKKALHRAAEASMTSCAHCHAVGGTSFAADSNCTKCHAVRDYSKH